MARPLRIQFPGAFYHVTSRGNARQRVFLDDSDRSCFFECLGKISRDYEVRILAYCLMDNHYHLLLETPRGNLSAVMRQLNGIYTQKFNMNHKRVGHVFQGRYKAVLVQDDSHLLAVMRYIALNPVRVAKTRDVGEWKWGSDRAVLGKAVAPKWLAIKGVLDRFGGAGRARSRAAYREFLRADLADGGSLSGSDAGKSILGEESFVQKIRSLIRDKSGVKDYPRRERFASRPALAAIFRGVSGKDERNKGIARAYRACGYSMTQIGKHLDLSCGMVSKILKRENADVH